MKAPTGSDKSVARVIHTELRRLQRRMELLAAAAAALEATAVPAILARYVPGGERPAHPPGRPRATDAARRAQARQQSERMRERWREWRALRKRATPKGLKA